MEYLPLLLFIPILILFFYFLWYDSAKEKGKRGEMRVSFVLSQLPEEYTVLNDVVFRTNKGTTQIDHIVVSKYGIFTIETKNYRGEIYGNDKRKEWTQIIVTEVTYAKKWWKTYTYVTKNQFYNPVKQSLGHAYRIKEVLSKFPHLKIVPIVVFAGDAVLTNVYSSNHVIYEEDLLSVISKYKTIYLEDKEVQNVINIIESNNVRDDVKDSEHISNIREAERKRNIIIENGVCPKCGGQLKERNGKYGPFYGCSNYPRCKFTVR